MKAKTTKNQKASKASKPRKPCKCSFVDDCYLKGNMTQEQILAAVLKKFPQSNPKSTLGTIRARPGHMRKAGLKPSWIPAKREPKQSATK